MTIINKSIVIDAHWEQVEAFLDRHDHLPDWYVGVVAVEPEPNFPMAVGTKSLVMVKAGGVTAESYFTVVKREPKLLEMQIDGLLSGINRWALIEQGNATQLNLSFDYQMSGGFLGKIMDRLFVERAYDKNAGESLNNLKQMVERIGNGLETKKR